MYPIPIFYWLIETFWTFWTQAHSTNASECVEGMKNSRLARKKSQVYTIPKKKDSENCDTIAEKTKNMTIIYRINCCECDEQTMYFICTKMSKKLLRLVQSICTTKTIS